MGGLTTTVRVALPEDLPAILEMGRAFWAESRYRDDPWDEAVARGTLADFGAQGLILVAEKRGEPVGYALIHVTRQMFGARLVGYESGIYLRPEHRGGWLAIRLVRAAEAWCRAQGADALYLTTSTGLEPERTIAFYGALGYQIEGVQMGRIFSKSGDG